MEEGHTGLRFLAQTINFTAQLTLTKVGYDTVEVVVDEDVSGLCVVEMKVRVS